MYAINKKKKRIPIKTYWKPGDPLTEADRELLSPIIETARKLGYTPIKAEVQNIDRLKNRFRTWGNCLIAADLPSLKCKEQKEMRQQK